MIGRYLVCNRVFMYEFNHYFECTRHPLCESHCRMNTLSVTSILLYSLVCVLRILSMIHRNCQEASLKIYNTQRQSCTINENLHKVYQICALIPYMLYLNLVYSQCTPKRAPCDYTKILHTTYGTK